MQPIDLSRLIKNATASKSDTASERPAGSTESQRLAIGLLLKQTIQSLANEGLLSVDTQKAVISAKNTLPGEFTQLYIQQRLQQHKLAESLASQVLKAAPLTQSTVSQWFSGQLIQGIVTQTPKNGLANLLVNAQGQFDTSLLAQLSRLKTDDTSRLQLSEALIRQAQQVSIKTELPLQAGQQLLLEVIKSKDSFSFKLNSNVQQSQQVSEQLNRLFNKQQSLINILSTLNDIRQQSTQAQKVFSRPFIEQVNKLIDQLPRLDQLRQAKDLKQAIQNSGQFLESRLAQNSMASNNSINQDFKAGLLHLQQMILNNQAVVIPKTISGSSSAYNSIAQTHLLDLQNQLHRFFDLPARVTQAQVQKPVKSELNLFLLNNPLIIQAQILDKLEGALARIISGQLQTRESSDQGFYNFEIPFRHNNQTEVLQLKIREQFKQREEEKGNKIWTVNLAFHLDSLGGIRIYITLDKMDISIQIWTEEKQALQLFQQYFYQLRERLQEAGFTISQLKAFHGIPDKARKEYKDSPFIIDEQV